MCILAGCGSKEVSFDVKTLAEELNSQISYQDTLTELDMDTASMFLNLSELDIVNGVVYEGSGATAEEIVVLECATSEDGAKAEQVLKDRVAEQVESFTDYVPAELTKLDAAVIRVNGKYAVLSVSDTPDAAVKIIEKYM